MAFSAKARKYLIAFLIIGWLSSLIHHYSNRINKPQKFYSNTQLFMGTFWKVTSPDKEASAIVFKEAARVEKLLSKYDGSSEVAQLNRLGKLKVSQEVFYILTESLEFWQISQGAFDITVGPLIDLWGFSDKQYRLPSDAQIKETLKLIGCDKIILRQKDNVVEFILPGMKIDLGGIGKGYALDCAVKKLKEKNIRSCLINAGGQVYALGDKGGKLWKIAVKDPRKEGVSETMELKNKSASTSADYEQFFLKDARRYCHILNPKTGYPAESGIISVTVISDSALDADALSTAVFVLGKEKAKRIREKFSNLEIKITE